MAGLIDAVLDTILDSLWGGDTIAWTPPATWYVALYEALPADDGTGGTEASFTGYARQAVANDATEWPAAVAGEKTNASLIDYGIAGSGPTVIVGFGFYDAATGGALWFTAPVAGGGVTISNGGDASFAPGAIVIDRCA